MNINVLTLREHCLLDKRKRETVTDVKISNFKRVRKITVTVSFVPSVRPSARFATTLDFCRNLSTESYWIKLDRSVSYCCEERMFMISRRDCPA